jgi:hypothetical protein
MASLLNIVLAREDVLSPIVMPKVDSILNTLIERTNYVIQQIKNPTKPVRNLLNDLQNYAISVWLACDQMQILESVIKSRKIYSFMSELRSLMRNTENLVQSVNVLPLLEYLNKVLRTLNELNSDDEEILSEIKDK